MTARGLLIVEGHQAVTQMLDLFFSGRGYKVWNAATGARLSFTFATWRRSRTARECSRSPMCFAARRCW